MENDHPLEAALKGLEGEIRIALLRSDDGDHPLTGPFEVLAGTLEQLDGVVLGNAPPADSAPARPALVLGDRGRPDRIFYLVNPERRERAPFVELLQGLARGCPQRSRDWHLPLGRLSEPVELLVFVAVDCPHCPQAVRNAVDVALCSDEATVSVVDATLYPELAQRYGVRSVPVTLIDRGLSFTGVVPGGELAAQLAARGTAGHRRDHFRSLVQTGRHSEAAALIAQDVGGELFLEPWRQSVLSDRIGLMLVAEEALEGDSRALDGLVPALIEILGSDDASLRGDTADLLGRIGHESVRQPLEALRDDPNADVAEVASEALEELDEVDRS